MWSQVQTSPLAPALRLGLRPNSQLTRPSQGSHTKGKFWDTTLCTMASVGFPLGSAPCLHSCWEQCGAGRCAPILPCLHPLGSRAWLENTWVWSQPQGEKEEKKIKRKKRKKREEMWIWIGYELKPIEAFNPEIQHELCEKPSNGLHFTSSLINMKLKHWRAETHDLHLKVTLANLLMIQTFLIMEPCFTVPRPFSCCCQAF